MPKKSDDEKTPATKPIIVSRKPIVEDPLRRGGTGSELIPGPPTLDDKASPVKSVKREKNIKVSSEGKIEADEDSKSVAKKSEKSSTPALAAIKEVIEPDDDEEVPEPEEAPKIQSGEKKLTPDKEPAKESKPEEKPEHSGNEKEVEAEESTDKDNKDRDDKKDVEEDSEPKATVQPTDGLVDELAKKAVDKKNKDKEDRQADAKQQQINKLAESKKYALPIGEVTRRKNNRRMLIVLLLIILLAIVGANFAVDAGLVQTDIKPLTDVIPN